MQPERTIECDVNGLRAWKTFKFVSILSKNTFTVNGSIEIGIKRNGRKNTFRVHPISL